MAKNCIKSTKKDLFDRIIQVYPKLSPKKRCVADYIMKDYKNIFLFTAREIARKCNVSEPTIVRLSVDLGFSGYSEFLQYMKCILHTELTGSERLLQTSRETTTGTTIQRYCQNAIVNLNNMMTSLSEDDFKQIAHTIHQAHRVFVVGYRASSALAYHFGYLLKKVRENVLIDTNLTWELMDTLYGCGENALMVAIGFPRYPRRTIEVLKYAKKCNVRIVGFSDTPQSPIVALSDQYLIIDIEGVSFVDPFAHIIAFLGALVHEIAFIADEQAMRCISKFDTGVKTADEFYTESEIDQHRTHRLNESRITSLWSKRKEKKV